MIIGFGGMDAPEYLNIFANKIAWNMNVEQMCKKSKKTRETNASVP